MPRKDISFKEHFEQLLSDRQKLENERWDAHHEVHKMGQLAVDAAVRTLDARLETMNEFRAQISKERGEYVKQQVYDSERRATEEKMDVQGKAFDTRVRMLEDYKNNLDGRFWMLGIFVTLLSVGIGFLFRFLGR